MSKGHGVRFERWIERTVDPANYYEPLLTAYYDKFGCYPKYFSRTALVASLEEGRPYVKVTPLQHLPDFSQDVREEAPAEASGSLDELERRVRARGMPPDQEDVFKWWRAAVKWWTAEIQDTLIQLEAAKAIGSKDVCDQLERVKSRLGLLPPNLRVGSEDSERTP